MDRVVHFRSAVCLLGRFPALAGLDLDVARGEIVLLAGPNGAGKTSLLRACAGLLPVVDGTAHVLGIDLRRDRRAVRRRVGMVAHGALLYDDLTVAENLSFWTRAAEASDHDAAAAVDRVGLDERLWDVPVAQLSAGQRRRTALAVLLARRPELWLLDEPHAGLDEVGRRLLDRLLREAADAGATVLLVSHELERSKRVVDRTVRVDSGVAFDGVVRDGEPPSMESEAASDDA